MTDTPTLIDKTRDLLRRAFHRDESERTREIVDTLKEVPLFRGFSRGTLRELAAAVHVRAYKRDEFIYYERDPGLGMYVVQRGRVRLLVEDDDGAVQELRQVGRHELFGVLSVLGDFRRMETAQALTDTNVVGFFRPDVSAIVKRQPSTGAAVLAALARQLAAREVELMRLLAEKEGKIDAMRLFDGAAGEQTHG